MGIRCLRSSGYLLLPGFDFIRATIAFASKPAPTVEMHSKCGSGLAREGVSPVNDYSRDSTPNSSHTDSAK